MSFLGFEGAGTALIPNQRGRHSHAPPVLTGIVSAAFFLFLPLAAEPAGAGDLALGIALESLSRMPEIQITGSIGTSCRLEYADALTSSPTWQLLSNVTLSATSFVVVDRTASPERARFYRAVGSGVDTGLRLWLKFDGDLNGVDGETPLSYQAITYRPGKAGQAVYLDATGHIRYAIADNLESAEGTIEFWIQPEWNGTNGNTKVFFEAGDNFNKGLLISKDGASNLRFLQWGDDPATSSLEIGTERGLGFSGADWIKGQWYHLAVTWKAATRELAFYLDGETKQTAVNGVNLSSFSTAFFAIGAEIDNAQPAEATFDELRIFNRVRTADQIWQDYLDPAGAPK
jgi:hypothetical protein